MYITLCNDPSNPYLHVYKIYGSHKNMAASSWFDITMTLILAEGDISHYLLPTEVLYRV